MTNRRTRGAALVAVLAGLLVMPACNRRQPVEVNPIVPSIELNRTRAPLGSALEIQYTWTVEPGARKLDQDYRAFVQFLDSHEVILFQDDHLPVPPPSSWEPGHTYTYARTVFIPVYPYVGEVEVRMGLYPYPGRGERPVLKGEDRGFREYKVATMELLPQTENIFLVYKSGWHNPETHPENPSIERTWTEKEAVVSFKNPKTDIVVYLQADTCVKCFPSTPELTVSVGSNVGIKMPIEEPQVFLKKIRVKAEDLGDEEWVDLTIAMNESFIPNQLDPPLNNDDRELGLNVYHLYVADADTVGPAEGIVDAERLGPAPPAAP
ncbi:MAG: hypothetical protein PVJ73_01755 [Acidobacteriota bacterium]|jgi:hypothetical protein